MIAPVDDRRGPPAATRGRAGRGGRWCLVGALALALVGVACAAGTGDAAGELGDRAAHDQAVRFATCMRENGVPEFPDPGPSGALTIEDVANRSSLDPSSPALDAALTACEDLEPPGFTGPGEVSPEQQDARLEFARCMREHGVADFPDPTPDSPLVDTNRIPSSGTDAGMTVLDAAMATCGELVADAVGDR